jgi:hypothetical protein
MRGVREHGFNRHNLDVTNVTSTPPSQTTYASEMGVSRKTVNDWEFDAKILDKSPDLKEAVLAGKMQVAEAVAIVEKVEQAIAKQANLVAA